ncbi:MAG TPA: DUF3134 family protein [Chroococcidiopsis sp.]
MTVCYPALSEEPRNQPIKIVAIAPRESLLSWLESAGRLHAADTNEFQEQKISEDLDDILEPQLYGVDNEEEEDQD